MAKDKAVPAPYTRAGQRATKDGLEGWRLRPVDPKSGRQIERVFYGTYEEALLELSGWQKSMSKKLGATVGGEKQVTVADWALAWIEEYQWVVPPTAKQKGVPRRWPTVAKHRDVLTAYIVPALGANTRLHTLTHQRCLTAIADLALQDKKTAASASTKETVASTMRLWLKGAVTSGILDANPASALPSRWEEGTRKRTTIPSFPEVTKMSQWLRTNEREHYADILDLFAYTGLRVEELTGLRISDIDFERRYINVQHTRTSSGGRISEGELTKSAAGTRTVVLLDQALVPLLRLVEHSRKKRSLYAVTGKQGGPLAYSSWRKNLKLAREATGSDYSAHALRHLFASTLLASGETVEFVRVQLGHSSPRVTEAVYKHAIALDRTELAERLSAAVTGIVAEQGDGEEGDDE